MTWARRADMPLPLANFGSAVATNGKTYVFGGFPTSGAAPVASVEAFDPIANTWTMKTPMPTARANPGVVVAADGSIYVLGGQSDVEGVPLSNVERYDPASDTWTTRAPMPTARFYLGAARSADGRIYAIGGSQGGYGANQLATVEIYDPTTDTWETGPSLPGANDAFGTVVGPDSRIYVMGGCCTTTGSLGLTSVYALNPGANSWTRLSDMPYGFLDPYAVTASNNKIYIVGGSFTVNSFNGPNISGGFVEEYNPLTDTWTTRSAAPYPYSWGAVFASNGKIEVLGACAGGGASQCIVTEEGTLPAPGTLPDLLVRSPNQLSPGSYVFSMPHDR